MKAVISLIFSPSKAITSREKGIWAPSASTQVWVPDRELPVGAG